MSAANLTVHTLTIDHRYGTNTDLFTTAEALEEALEAWVNLYWQAEVPPATERPEDPLAAREVYFEAAGESYTIDQAVLALDATYRLAEVTDVHEVSDLVDAKIELLSEYKLEYPKDYDESDIARMKTEISRLETLRDRLAGLRS